MKRKKSTTEQELSLNDTTPPNLLPNHAEPIIPQPTKLVVKDNIEQPTYEQLKAGDWFKINSTIYIKSNDDVAVGLNGSPVKIEKESIVAKIKKVNLYIN